MIAENRLKFFVIFSSLSTQITEYYVDSNTKVSYKILSHCPSSIILSFYEYNSYSPDTNNEKI